MTEQLLVGGALGLIVAVASYRFKLLQPSGSVATFALALVIYGLGGLMWTLPIFTFFVLSSALSRIGRARKRSFELLYEKSSQRDAWQVLANGGVGGVIIICSSLHPSELWYMLYLGSIAAVTADTWATELGVFSGKPPRSVLAWSSVASGTSGAVSLTGTLGGLCGAFVIALTGMPFMTFTPGELLKIIVAGGVGSLVDSILGATVQAQYRCVVCEKHTERNVHCTQGAVLVRGSRWITNDVVNLSCAITGALVAWFLSPELFRRFS